jgi:hypothetical protein
MTELEKRIVKIECGLQAADDKRGDYKSRLGAIERTVAVAESRYETADWDAKVLKGRLSTDDYILHLSLVNALLGEIMAAKSMSDYYHDQMVYYKLKISLYEEQTSLLKKRVEEERHTKHSRRVTKDLPAGWRICVDY